MGVHYCSEHGCFEVVVVGERFCSRHAEEATNVRRCMHEGCRRAVADDEDYCRSHDFERQSQHVEHKSGTHAPLTDEERAAKRAERDKREAVRRARQLEVSQRGPKGMASGGGGKASKQSNPEKARKRARKKEQKK